MLKLNKIEVDGVEYLFEDTNAYHDNIETTVSEDSTDNKIASAKCVYAILGDISSLGEEDN